MDAEKINKEYEQELLLLQLNGMMKLHEEDRKHQEELRRNKQNHHYEMVRLRGKESEEQHKVQEFERKRVEESRRHESEMMDIERINLKEEEKLRDEKMKLFKENLKKEDESFRSEANQLQILFNESLMVHANLDKIEEIKTMKKIVLEVDTKWSDVKKSYELTEEVYFLTGEKLEPEDKEYLLQDIESLLAKKLSLEKHLCLVNKGLGKWKSIADEKCYEDVKRELEKLQTAMKNFEKAILNLRKTIKLNNPIEGAILPEINSIISSSDATVNNLTINPMLMKTSFQEMLGN
ncbi:hypothetical protein L5515_011177 [Caenorhabditis briggsae]|uniref:Uncharacterized protein n=1 Tax=Caenorhabditis briggsae TaxID=6238 RepID=A0AAE9EUV3_CAEBR|nr:hypothetical protein L5515_011177 [Caenorhabditis briggsae]